MSDGKSIVVTGHAGGIGSVIADKFRREGYAVLGIDMRSNSAVATAELVLDLRDIDRSIPRLNQFLANNLHAGSLVGLVNCAALQVVSDVADLSQQDLSDSLAVNVSAPLVLAQAMLTMLAENQGVIVNIGSIHAKLTKPRFLAYSVSKSALSGLTKALAVEVGHLVSVVEIQPAAVATEMLLDGFRDNPDQVEELARLHPSGSIGAPQDVAECAWMLVDKRMKFLNGAVINLDGGISHLLVDPDNS